MATYGCVFFLRFAQTYSYKLPHPGFVFTILAQRNAGNPDSFRQVGFRHREAYGGRSSQKVLYGRGLLQRYIILLAKA